MTDAELVGLMPEHCNGWERMFDLTARYEDYGCGASLYQRELDPPIVRDGHLLRFETCTVMLSYELLRDERVNVADTVRFLIGENVAKARGRLRSEPLPKLIKVT
jgi:hypothetical protein